MTTLALETEPTAIDLTLSDSILLFIWQMVAGLSYHWLGIHASCTRLLQNGRTGNCLATDGYAIEFPDLDEHIGVEGLLAGRQSGESQKSLARWLTARKQK